MKTALLLLTLVALAAAPGASAECVDLQENGEVCADEGGWDAVLDAEVDEVGLSLHVESHGSL